ncbi:hypothetical protein RHGRI_007515 [Rhododendron griersonianum]|uniref:Secreted protein n=1 Tax=Rhododendron griersonianum TaxID=479676 RepID=A0AAV6KX30_9ERIC|nr:hypothetical protein RHGRI_007515 [Rhododendron griersonianum]
MAPVVASLLGLGDFRFWWWSLMGRVTLVGVTGDGVAGVDCVWVKSHVVTALSTLDRVWEIFQMVLFGGRSFVRSPFLGRPNGESPVVVVVVVDDSVGCRR